MSCYTPACPPTNVKFQLRRATAQEWRSRNPQLRAGEPGVETDTGQMKIGNEACDRWNDLPYVGSSDLEAIRNLALNAFIWDATVSAIYDPANLQIIVDTTFYGNSSYYDLTYTLSPSTIATTTGYFVNNGSKIFNNLSPTAPPNSTVGHNTFQKIIPITNLVVGNNILTVNITTQNAGGLGRYSTKQIQTTINLTQNDSMGSPIILITSQSTSFSNVQTLRISSIYYYTNGTIVNFPQGSIRFNNIYNIIQYPSLPYNFLTIADSSGSSTTIENTTRLYYGANLSYPASSGTNQTYYNFPVSYTLNGSSYTSPDRITITAVNPKTLTGFTGYGGTAGKAYIGYIGSGWNPNFERIISLNQGRPTISGITSIERMSNAGSNALTPLNSQILTFNPESIRINDPFYLPYQNIFVSDTDLTTFFTDIQLPLSVPTNPGVRYLTLEITNTAVLQTFTLLIGNSSRPIVNVINMSVKWYDSVNNQYYPSADGSWYNGLSSYINSGGCQKGVSGNWYTYQININVGDMTSYSLSNGAGGGKIWIIIQYSGSIYKNDINII